MPPPFQSDRRSQQLRKLTEVSRALTYALSLQEVLNLTVQRAAELLDAERAVLMLTDEEGLLSIGASHGLDRAARFREPMHETLITRLQALLGATSKEHFLAVPLVVGGEVSGLLAVARSTASTNAEEDEWLLSALADQAAVALEKTRLDHAAELRERILGIVSHDLRNPISSILMGSLALLRQPDLDEKTIKAVTRIRSSAERAHRMIRDLLDFTQTRMGGAIRLDRRPMDLHAAARQVADELQVTQPGRALEVTQEGDTHGVWDLDRLTQVIGNLVSNALQYGAPDVPVRIDVRGADDMVTLSVHNRGPTIPPEREPHLFEPMQRGSEGLSSTDRSVGLGLYIVKHLVEAHRGTVSLRSTNTEGTTFTVRLPRQASPPTGS